jgi:crossover junction endodeoxyribonuclease RusA
MTDSVEVSFPVEFFVIGEAVSMQNKSKRGLEAWKELFSQECYNHRPQNAFLTETPLSVLIYHFPDGKMTPDIDNIIKPILDAMKGVIYLDDRIVERVTAQKFEAGRFANWSKPSATLFGAISGQKPLTYVKVSTEPHEDIL